MSLNEIPGYKDALDAERNARDHAFITAVPRQVAGFDLRPMTLLDLTIRLHINCPFLCGNAARPGDVASFLWQVRAAPAVSRRARKKKTERQVFVDRIVSMEYAAATKDINDYLDWTFLDAPSSRSGPLYTPKTSFAATMVHVIAAQYHWSEEAILNLPLVRLYQYLREIIMAKNPGVLVFNRRSDKVRGEYLRSLAAAQDAGVDAGKK